MSKTTDALKGSFIRVESIEASIEVQKLLFKLGFKWITEERVIKKDLPMYFPGWIYVDTNCRIWQDSTNRYKGVTSGQDFGKFKEIDKLNILKAVTDYAEEKRQKKRISRLKKKGWIENKGVDPAVKNVDVVFSSGEQGLSCASHIWSWSIYGQDCDITHYRPSNQHHPQQKSKWTKWVADEHSEYPGHPNDVVEIVTNDGPRTVGSAFNFSWVTCEWYKESDIRKYRVVKTAEKARIDALVEWSNGEEQRTASFEEMVNDIVKDAVEVVEKPVDTNPKKQFGDKSVPLHMWSGLASAYGALALYNGSLKYGSANFTNTPVEASIYIAAAFRHLNAWIAGEEFDPADGVPNLGGVLANIAILLEARAAGTLIDNRLKMDGYLKEREALKEIVANLQKLHEGKNPKHYTLE